MDKSISLMSNDHNSIMKELGTEEKSIYGKRVYVFEEHHHALYPWAVIKRERIESNLVLVTFDYHTDTHKPFLDHACERNSIDYDLIERLVSSIDYNSNESLLNAIEILKHDEHIQTAICCGILNDAFIIAQGTQNEDNAHIIQNSFWLNLLGDDLFLDDDNNGNEEMILEDIFLKEHFKEFSKKNSAVQPDGKIQMDYILDIDLDYFSTPAALEPTECSIISTLIKNAKAITIAKESSWVNDRTNKMYDSNYMLSKLLSLIEKSLS